MRLVVADTSPLNYLVLIEQVEILPALFEKVFVPQIVRHELQHSEAPERAYAAGSRSHPRVPGARIGTVDKFQGQEAPIVIYSMTTSSHADAPCGMEFLYGANRFNVATSRAKCICVVVASPRVFEAECRTPRQMQLANAFCRYLELATLL
ncbi:MAG TPA: AAA domain-containing protein [Bradyrhizobium sp.]|nr:AAA domain-containing protein [Bradyrhizobium sp.]